MLDKAVSKRRFKGMLARVFSDGVVNDAEAEEVRAFLSSGELTPDEVKDVIADFVQLTWRVTVADSEISEREKVKLREIVRVLEIPQSTLPPAWAEALLQP